MIFVRKKEKKICNIIITNYILHNININLYIVAAEYVDEITGSSQLFESS